MSAPAPLTVKTPALYVAEPASAGEPMSASVQGLGRPLPELGVTVRLSRSCGWPRGPCR